MPICPVAYSAGDCTTFGGIPDAPQSLPNSVWFGLLYCTVLYSQDSLFCRCTVHDFFKKNYLMFGVGRSKVGLNKQLSGAATCS